MKLLFVFVLSSLSITVYSQSVKSSRLPNSLVNMELNYMLIGAPRFDSKLLVGSKNTGFFMGYQWARTYEFEFDDFSSYTFKAKTLRLGYQRGFGDGLHASLSFDWCSYSSIYLTQEDSSGNGFRLNLGIGYTYNLLKSKRLYLNAQGVLHLVGVGWTQQFISTGIGRFCQISIGVGYRLGSSASTKYEGVKNVTTVPSKR